MHRSKNNPILTPSTKAWEDFAVFNPSLIVRGDAWHMLYRAMGQPERVHQHELRLSRLGIARSDNGEDFTDRRIFLEPRCPYDAFGCEDPRVTFFEGKYYAFYTALGGYPFSKDNIKVAVAVSDDLRTINERYLVTPFNAKAMTLFPEWLWGKVTALLSVNTDNPPAHCAVVQVDHVEDLWDPMMWYQWSATHRERVLTLSRFNTDHVEVGCAPVRCEMGWLLVYCHIYDYFTKGARPVFAFEAVVLNDQNPLKVLAPTLEPILKEEEPYEREGTVPNVIFPTSLIEDDDSYRLYYGATDTTVALASISKRELLEKLQTKITVVPKASKLHYPIIAPRPECDWEKNGTFNPGCWDDGKNIHILYRAQSDQWTSQLGYARLNSPYNVDLIKDAPVYIPRAPFETKLMKSGYSGCKDPRLTQIGDTLYMLYTAYDGVNPPLVALTQIEVADFLRQNWAWTQPKLISRPGQMDKNALLFPEIIGGCYVMLNRIEPNICITFIPEDEFVMLGSGERGLDGKPLTGPRQIWESAKIGANCPPMRIEQGWLLVYHGVDKRDAQYRVGFMLLDINHPDRILARTPYPVLEPTLPWERHGVVPNVTVPCGATLRDNRVYLYYGGADTVVGVAMLPVPVILAAMVLEYLGVAPGVARP